ncbi:hypothetical protein WA588_004812 [Blastocystis sp. NMH]
MNFYYYHFLTWPSLSWVAEDEKGRIVGYVLGKLNEDDETMGQITSVAVCREYRRLGIAHKLMRQSQIKMIEVYNCKTCALHVRESNYAARHMYEDVLGFKLATVDVKYYADGENGLLLKLDLEELRKSMNLPPFKGLKDTAASEKKEEPEPRQRKVRKG